MAQVHELLAREQQRFAEEHPRSYALHQEAARSLLAGVPMNWMTRWASPVPPFVTHGQGARVTDVDGHEYIDFALGDTGAMAGHAPPAAVAAIAEQAARGITFMLPTEDSNWAGEEMARRFGLPFWQFTLTATDANRFVVRLARQITGRPKIIVHNWCYHGSVDETLATTIDGAVQPRPGNVGPPVHPSETTRVVEFNDIDALEQALAEGDVACVLAEPALTNIGIVLPEPGYHDALRELTRKHGTLLVIDETHTICAGPGGYTAAHDLEPDVLTIGKTIGAGVPAGAYGLSAAVAEAALEPMTEIGTDVSGIGGTLAANALSMAAIRATLGEVLTEEAFTGMIALAERFEAGVQDAIDEFSAPWHVTRLGCRAEFAFRATPPRTGAEAAAAGDPDLERLLHLYTMNRGILLTPFHNMALMSPATTEEDIDRHTEVFREAVAEIFA
jgi:glutamate-1-semialdehyde 2,1-aminomutase